MPQQPIPPPRKQWYDKLADAILGDEDSTSSASKYALICQKCFAHNGLIKESLWLDTRKCTHIYRFRGTDLGLEYVCPKCGHFNSSARSQDQHSPQSADGRKVSPAPAQRAPRASLKGATEPAAFDEGNSIVGMDVDS